MFKANYFFLLCLLVLSGCSSQTGGINRIVSEGKGIVTDSGMVVSSHRESSRIGNEILMKGGNAIDAAVATEFALAVCYPEAGNIGGGGFMVIRLQDGSTDVIDYREKAPLEATRDMYLDKSGNVTDGLSTGTHLASGVPGTVDGVISAHSKYGKLPFSEVVQPAIDLAAKGFKLSARQAQSLNSNRASFLSRNSEKTAFAGDSIWKEGDILIQTELASTLQRIRDLGRDGFYSGITARLIVKEMKRGNGIITVNDLNSYKSSFRKPIETSYRGYRIVTVPPPSSGGVILTQLLKMTEPFSLSRMGFHSAEAVHLMVESERRAFADRAEYLGDPDYMKVSVEKLTSGKYIARRMSGFNKEKATPSAEIKPGLPETRESEETTHYSVVDARGNAVSVTTTLNGTFGNSIVVDSAGFLLNNQMDDFSVKPGFPNMYGLVGGEANSVQPGKKMLSSMTPVIIDRNGKLFLVAGSPGGSTIPTTVFQVVVNVIDFGMDVKEAVDEGRFHHQWLPDVVSFEKGSIDSLTVRQLTSMGHSFSSRSVIGSVNAIRILSDGKRSAGADKRGNNTAFGY